MDRSTIGAVLATFALGFLVAFLMIGLNWKWSLVAAVPCGLLFLATYGVRRTGRYTKS